VSLCAGHLGVSTHKLGCHDGDAGGVSVSSDECHTHSRFKLRRYTVQDSEPYLVLCGLWRCSNQNAGLCTASIERGYCECNGCMDSSGRVALPSAFEDANIDNLALLIGNQPR